MVITRDRPQYLRPTLIGLASALGKTVNAVQLVVVDDSTLSKSRVLNSEIFASIFRASKPGVAIIDQARIDEICPHRSLRSFKGLIRPLGNPSRDVAAARNAGLLWLRSCYRYPPEVVTFLDDDVVLHRGQRGWAEMLSGAITDRSIVGGVLTGAADMCSLVRMKAYLLSLATNVPLGRALRQMADEDKEGSPSPQVSGGLMTVPWSLLTKCMFPRLYNEDWLLMGLLGSRHGVSNRVVSSLVGAHSVGVSLAESILRLPQEIAGEIAWDLLSAVGAPGLESSDPSRIEGAFLRLKQEMDADLLEVDELATRASNRGSIQSDALTAALDSLATSRSLVQILSVDDVVQPLISAQVGAVGLGSRGESDSFVG